MADAVDGVGDPTMVARDMDAAIAAIFESEDDPAAAVVVVEQIVASSLLTEADVIAYDDFSRSLNGLVSCGDFTCNLGEICNPQTGTCEAQSADPCADVACASNEFCSQGDCYLLDDDDGRPEPPVDERLCAGVECPVGLECDVTTGECVGNSRCEDIDCDDADNCTNDVCIAGECFNDLVDCGIGLECDAATGGCVSDGSSACERLACAADEACIRDAAGLAHCIQISPALATKSNGAPKEGDRCPTTVIFVNGVMTNRDAYGKGLQAVRNLVHKEIPDAFVMGYYNKSASDADVSFFGGRICPFLFDDSDSIEKCRIAAGVFLDFKESFEQVIDQFLDKLGVDPCTYRPGGRCDDAVVISRMIRRGVEAGRRVILVPHSQGNFFVQRALRMLPPDIVSSVGVIQLGSPTSTMTGKMVTYIKNCNDPVATLVADAACGEYPVRVTEPGFGRIIAPHDLIRAYLFFAQTRIRTVLKDMDEKLTNSRCRTISVTPTSAVLTLPDTQLIMQIEASYETRPDPLPVLKFKWSGDGVSFLLGNETSGELASRNDAFFPDTPGQYVITVEAYDSAENLLQTFSVPVTVRRTPEPGPGSQPPTPDPPPGDQSGLCDPILGDQTPVLDCCCKREFGDAWEHFYFFDCIGPDNDIRNVKALTNCPEAFAEP